MHLVQAFSGDAPSWTGLPVLSSPLLVARSQSIRLRCSSDGFLHCYHRGRGTTPFWCVWYRGCHQAIFYLPARVSYDARGCVNLAELMPPIPLWHHVLQVLLSTLTVCNTVCCIRIRGINSQNWLCPTYLNNLFFLGPAQSLPLPSLSMYDFQKTILAT